MIQLVRIENQFQHDPTSQLKELEVVMNCVIMMLPNM